ncbi:hypothetical protein KJ039_05640 [bacterium]|nr:hypothetical protein [bacterium]
MSNAISFKANNNLIPPNHAVIAAKYGYLENQGIPSYRLIFENPILFDRLAFEWLFSKYGDYLKEILEKLHCNEHFLAFRIDEKFKNYLDSSLVCKQLLPLFATADAYDELEKNRAELIDTGVAYVLTKTASLNFIDTHVDLSLSYNIKRDIAEEKDSRLSVLLSITSIFRGCDHFLNLPNGNFCLKIITEVFAHVMEIMTEDYCNRFNENDLINPKKRIQLYDQNFLSPFLGSGFYEATIRSALKINGKKENPYLINWLRDFRKLRQMIDEIADIEEDIRVGRLTYPVLLGLEKPFVGKEISSIVKNIWNLSRPIIKDNRASDMETILKLNTNEEIKKSVSILYDLLNDAHVWDELYEKTEELCLKLLNNIEYAFLESKNPTGLILILLLKRAFLERLRKQNWRDLPLGSLSVAEQADFRKSDFVSSKLYKFGVSRFD